MFHVILYQPEIPPNTGNIIRLCANTGCQLHLIKPLGFALEDKQLIRAGLDYHEFATLRVHDTLQDCMAAFDAARVFALTTNGSQPFHQVRYQAGDAFLFGPESRGLPAGVLAQFDAAQRVRLPMLPDNRSLNLSNAAAVAVFEAWRQCGFGGARGED
ncbi:MAG: tRNA (uridine(34)/cytosine(34)/5-carboxymethylaminomethyluridine(34)-2'-O)-methyltransferase TrmL [Gallionellales bacterium GWA2_60_18]|nr:MAG: tRNA (uridine(34)/cytosine(34)/5-carboxymethylaminomethyluridine(34)-2'-O)-methyltransferase TrmL [Gallionellales bacterium GWA2_60_18]